MAKVVLTIEDAGEGLHLNLESDPCFPPGFEGCTNAQSIGAMALSYIQKTFSGAGDEIEVEYDDDETS